MLVLKIGDGRRGPRVKEYGKPLEAEKAKKTESPLKLPGRKTALLTF